MLGIILTILKYVGIAAGSLFLLLLFFLLLLLLVPIKYDMKGCKEEKSSVNGKIHWLFPLISYRVVYENDEMKQVLRILGVPVWKK